MSACAVTASAIRSTNIRARRFELFEALLAKLRADVVQQLMHVQISTAPPPPLENQALPLMQASHIDPLTGEDEFAYSAAAARLAVDPNNPATWSKVQRNAACPCGSGRKYKHCHGALV